VSFFQTEISAWLYRKVTGTVHVAAKFESPVVLLTQYYECEEGLLKSLFGHIGKLQPPPGSVVLGARDFIRTSCMFF